MKYIFHVAIREFAENAKTKGFWIGLLLFPVIIWVCISASKWLETATPVRHVVLIDQSETYEPSVERALKRDYTRQRLAALDKHMQEHIRPDFRKKKKEEKTDFEKIPGDLQAIYDKMYNKNTKRLDLAGTPAGWKKEVALRKTWMEEDAPAFEDPKPNFRRVALPEGISATAAPKTIVDSLRPYLLGDKRIDVDGERVKLFAAVIIPKRVRSENVMDALPGQKNVDRGIQYWSLNLTDNDFPNLVKRAVNEEYRRARYEKELGKDSVSKVKKIANAKLLFNLKNPKKKEGQEDVSMADIIRQWAPVAFVYLLWIAIFTISQMLLNNTIEEKSNRIIEVLLSSVTSGELMIGKLLGIAAVGMTMVGAWILSLIGILSYMRGPETEMVNAAFSVITDSNSNLLLMFAIYFVLGYLFYAGIFLSIGSICNTIKEAQNFMGTVTLIMMVPLITMFFIPKDPNGTLATVLSWIPIYTPFVMMNRAAADPPMFDQIGTIVLMVVCTLLVLWLSGKIFRIGILRTGQPPKIMELFRWMKAAD